MCDEFIMEQAKSVIYASTRMDVPELAKVRELLVEKYTNSILPDREIGVYPRLVLKLAMSNPERGLCEKYLEAIADNFGIDWESSGDTEDKEREREHEKEREKESEKEREEALLNLLSSTSSHSLSDNGNANANEQLPSAKSPATSPTSLLSAPLPMQQTQKKQNLPDFDEFTRRFEALRKK